MATDDSMPVPPEERALLIEAKRHELAVREKEVERLTKKDQLDHIFAMTSLEKQSAAVDQAHSSGKWIFGWGIAIVVLLIIVAATLVILGHKDVVMEGVKIGGAFLVGGVGGWGVRASRVEPQQ